MVLYSTQKGFFYWSGVKLATVAEPSSGAVQNHAQHILSQSEETFHHAENYLSMKWFHKELVALNRTIPFFSIIM